MVDIRISEMDPTEALDGSELFEVSQYVAGMLESRKTTLDEVVGYSKDNMDKVVYPIGRNGTVDTIPKGTPVRFAGSDGTYGLIEPMIADGSAPPYLYVGLTMDDITASELGRVVFFGAIDGMDTSSYTSGTQLYVSPTVAGEFTDVKPESPNPAILSGVVTISDPSNGRIFVRHQNIQDSSETPYDNSGSTLVASNVQSAVDELDAKKASLDDLSSNIVLYPTDTASGIGGYTRAVTSVSDPDFDTTPVTVASGAVTGAAQLVASFIADANLFTGNPGIFTSLSLVEIAKTVGNSSNHAEFFFRIYKRASGGTETLIAESGTTGIINPGTLSVFAQYSISALFNDGVFTDTDRVVIKWYANATGGTASQYNLRIGGSNPTRTTLPVPITVIPSGDASDILVDTSGFDNVFGPTDDDVQAALQKLDDTLGTAAYAAMQSSATDRTAGRAADAQWAITTDGDQAIGGGLSLGGPLTVQSYTTGTLPSAAANPRAVVYNSTLGKHVFSNGSEWKDYVEPDGTVKDYAGADRRVGWMQAIFAPAGNLTLGNDHIGHQVSAQSGTSSVSVTTSLTQVGVILLINNTSNSVSITQGAGKTLTWLQGGSSATGNRSLAPRSIAYIDNTSSTAAFIWGDDVS